MTLSFTVRPRRIALILELIAVVLAITSISLKVIEWNLRTSNYFVYSISGLFNINREATVPTFFSALLLFFAVALLVFCTRLAFKSGDGLRWFWFVLAIIFAYLMIDEASEIHEIFSTPLEESYGLSGFAYFGWVVVGMIFVFVVGIPYLYFLLKLPSRTRWLFLLSGVIYIGGALIVESISANIWYINDGTSLQFSAVGTIEEFMEMSGVILFVYALMRHLQDHVQDVSLVFDDVYTED